MTKIPPPPPRKGPPPNLKSFIEQWNEAKRQLEVWKEEELTLRKFLATQLFPKPKEGINRKVLPGAGECALKHAVYRKVDKAAFSQMAPTLRKQGLNLDALVEMEPKLVLAEYRKLDERKRKIFEVVLAISDGTPALTIE